MRYIVSMTKVMVLVVLIAASILQTGRLWFDTSSDRSFFYDLVRIVDRTPAVQDTSGAFIEIDQLGVYIGAPDIEYTLIGRGNAIYKGISESLVKSIAVTLQSGTYIGTLTTDARLWDEQHYVMTLPFVLEADEIQDGLMLSDEAIGEVESVVSFYLSPVGQDGKSIDLFLEEGDGSAIHHYQINSEQLLIENELLMYNLDALVAEPSKVSYISTRKNPLSYYKTTMLLPIARGDIPYHDSVFWRTPYVNKGIVEGDGLQTLVSPFFKNPEIVGRIDYGDEVRFTSESITVRYDAKGILAYTRDQKPTRTGTRLNQALSLSEDFLKKHIEEIYVEYYLADYSENDTSITLYYHIGYNGYPIVMGEDAQTATNMRYPIEVTVESDQVTEFKTIVRSFEMVLPQFRILDMPYGVAMDHLISEIGPLNEPVDGMYLGYRWDGGDEAMQLYWHIDINGTTHAVKVVGR